MGEIAFIVDSAASFPKEWYEQNGISVVQLKLAFGDDEPILEFGISPQEFYSRLRGEKKLPSTAGAGLKELAEAYDAALGGARHAIMLTLLESASVTNSAAEIIADQEEYRGKITVIDTNTVGPAQGFIALEAKRFSESHNLEETIGYIEALRQNAKMYFCPETLEYLHKGGRVKGLEFFFGSMLRILPLISVKHSGNGSYRLAPVSRNRTMPKCVDSMLDCIAEDAKSALGEGLATADMTIVHGDNEALAQDVSERVSHGLGQRGIRIGNSLVSYLTPVVGTHAGPGAVGVSMLYR